MTANQLVSVSCPAASACIAVGSHQNGDQTFPCRTLERASLVDPANPEPRWI